MTTLQAPTVPADVLAWAEKFVPGTPPELCRTLAAVARYADPDGRNSHPLFPVLVAHAGVSESKARRDLAELVRRGLVEVSDDKPPSLLALPGNRPAVYHVPPLVGRAWERPGAELDAGECEVVAEKYAANSRGVTRSSKGVTAAQPLGKDRFEIAEALLNEINDPEIFAPTAYRLARNLLCAALKNGHTADWLRDLLAEPVTPDGTAASSQILVRLHAHQHPQARAERLPVAESAEPDAGNQTFVVAFDMAHQIARAQQTPRRQYLGHDFAELLHLLVAAALNGATRAELERIVGEDPPAGGDRASHVLGSLWALARGETRPPSSAKAAYAEEPVRVLVPVDVRDEALDNALADQDGPIPADEADTWAGRIVRRIVLAHGPLDDEQNREMRWRLVKALKNGQSPAHLARVLTRPTVTTDPCSELLHRASLHYWPGRTP